ncbi:hypothetical protein VKT23_017086 [Stygiomarasmius scandens]|uniref:Protein kinase domain-containing protein n=1 Tax=Marasmiellus scandens TaxID=2682957 RepID=A0ABR1IT79_9AGAR
MPGSLRQYRNAKGSAYRSRSAEVLPRRKCQTVGDRESATPQEIISCMHWFAEEFSSQMQRTTLVQARRATLDFCLVHSSYPRSLDCHPGRVITDQYPCRRGGSSDVYFGHLNNEPTAVKRFRSFQDSDEREIRKKFIKEALITQMLDHEHTIPFLTVQDNESGLYIVTPWMENGNIVQYLKAGPSGLEEKIVDQIAQGILYLREQSIVHADIKSDNILVDDQGNARIADFGNAFYLGQYDSSSSSDSSPGTHPWVAPELIMAGENREVPSPSFSSDVFAFGMVVYEIYSTDIPLLAFANGKQFRAAMLILEGSRPQRPSTIPDDMWILVQACWAQDPSERPSIDEICRRVSFSDDSAEEESAGKETKVSAGPRSSLHAESHSEWEDELDTDTLLPLPAGT